VQPRVRRDRDRSRVVPRQRQVALVFDNAVMNVCHLACTYCRPAISVPLQRRPRTRPELARRAELVRRISAETARALAPPVLKLSGAGEVFLFPNLVELVQELARDYRHIQLSTNGLLPKPRVLAALATLPVSLAVSLDGHTAAMNECRNLGAAGVAAVIRTVRRALDAGIPVEVFTTLTSANVSGLEEFVGYVRRELTGARCLPFPVRGVRRLAAPATVAAAAVGALLERHEHLADALPPRGYVERLAAFVAAGERTWPCLFFQASVSVTFQGDMRVCNCAWGQVVGNVLRDPAAAYRARRSLPIYAVPPATVPPPCRRCFTHFEALNGLLDGSTPIDDLELVPWLGWSGSRAWIARFRRRRDAGAP
jgi:sulfatase maturation enzyme AslB (radical SAM superfamily)